MLEIILIWLLAKLCGSSSSSTPEIAPGTPIDYNPSNPDQAAAEAARAAAEAARKAEEARRRAEEAERAKEKPQPWPQAIPAGLPAFPGGWEYDEPPPREVRERAWQLLDPLWKWGSGSTRTEKTGTRWITYRAEMTKGGKRGVVAYRIKPTRAVPVPGKPKPPVTASTTPPAAASPAAAKPAGKPLLVQGAGLGALANLQPWVRDAQNKLAAAGYYKGKIDGQFGKQTGDAVEAFQKARGLKVDRKIGDNTWAALDRAPSLLAS